jgi:acetyl-CoA C-acetyltransferase
MNVPSPDPRSPVVVGVGQVSQRVPPAEARAPIDLLTEAARLAEADASAAHSLLEQVGVIGIAAIGSWRYPDPGALLGRKLGVEPRATLVTTVGGNSPQLLCNELGARIQRGELDVALIGGGESMHTRWRARREPRVELTWETGDDAPCEWVIGDARPGSNDYEMAHSAVAPPLVYPLFETALRAANRRTVAEHQRHVSEVWSRFAAVAAGNPAAWSREAYTPEEIRTVAPDNRMVCFPYPKRMCANIDVDQAAALILCSYEAARAAGVADDRMVFLHASAEAHDHYFLTERWSLADSPAIAATVGDALDAAGLGADDVARFDLYSCFPSAVQVAAHAIGLADDDPRPLTVTGGLGFAGGPVNNYPTHAIARMVEVLRGEPASYGCTTALGWYLTKHAAGVWSARPPERGFRRLDSATTQARVDRRPRRETAGLLDGDVTIEATSVNFERDGSPVLAIVSALTGDGRRALANSRDPNLLQALTTEAHEGRAARITNDGTANTIHLG